MSKNFKILITIIIICLIVAITVIMKMNNKTDSLDNNQKAQEKIFLHDNSVIVDENGYVLKGSRKNSVGNSTEKLLEKHELVKGFVSYISNEGFIEINNSYKINTLGMNVDEYNCFFTKISFSPKDVVVINYYTGEEMKLEEISINDLVLFDVKIIYSTLDEPIITVEDNKIFVLNEKDLYSMVIEKYKGERVLKNVKIVNKEYYNFKNEEYTYIHAQIKFNSSKNDELVYCFVLQLSDDTIVENNEDSKYADIVLEENFENLTTCIYSDYCRKVYKIIYK